MSVPLITILGVYSMVTAACTLHPGKQYGIETGRPASFFVSDSKSWFDALSTNAVVLYSCKNGRVAESVPETSRILF